MKPNILDKSDGNRNSIVVACKCCKLLFRTRADQPLKCCSLKCSGVLRRTREKLTCYTCGVEFERQVSKLKNSKSGRRYCSRKCQTAAYRENPPNYTNGKWAGQFEYRDLFTEEEFVCARCGYSEFSCGVDIHHIDENRKNNSRDNLIPLCTPCHRGLHHGLWDLVSIISR